MEAKDTVMKQSEIAKLPGCGIDPKRKSWIKNLSGIVETDVGAHYSGITGFLWYDQEVNIGGHDLIAELRSFIGKYLILVIDIQEVK